MGGASGAHRPPLARDHQLQLHHDRRPPRQASEVGSTRHLTLQGAHGHHRPARPRPARGRPRRGEAPARPTQAAPEAILPPRRAKTDCTPVQVCNYPMHQPPRPPEDDLTPLTSKGVRSSMSRHARGDAGGTARPRSREGLFPCSGAAPAAEPPARAAIPLKEGGSASPGAAIPPPVARISKNRYSPSKGESHDLTRPTGATP